MKTKFRVGSELKIDYKESELVLSGNNYMNYIFLNDNLIKIFTTDGDFIAELKLTDKIKLKNMVE